MNKNELEHLLAIAKLSKTDFAKHLGTKSSTISNWGCGNQKVPYWVKTWLENYIMAKCYKDIRESVNEIENTRSGN